MELFHAGCKCRIKVVMINNAHVLVYICMEIENVVYSFSI